MPLDPQAQKIIDALAALNLPPVEDSTPEEARESMRSRTAALGPFEDVAAVTDHRVPVKNGEITVRVYSPGGKGPQPALVFFHGGGWVIGDLYTHDGICRSITNAAACVVASVDYRLAPELKYPVAAEDSYAGYAWVLANAGKLGIDARRVAVGGDSAGGNLAAAVSLMARDRGTPVPIQQTLIYPVTNHSLDTPSYRENATGFLLTRDAMRWFWNHYLASEGQGKEPYASPLLAKSLAGLPPALVITAGCDPLRDEGEAYAARLRDAGVPVTLTRYEGLFHGFIRMTRMLDKAKAALDEIAGSLKKAFA
jgi:acetyl esterase